MKRQLRVLAAVATAAILNIGPGIVRADVKLDGFMQGLYGGRLDKKNPTSSEQTANESRLQLRLEQTNDNSEFFGRLDFVYDGTADQSYIWELREGYLKTRLGNHIDLKLGRQILTWGTGDLIFINDVFAKDYRSFFIGRDDQYLKAPQNALRMEYYGGIGSLALVWTPQFEPNRLPDGRTLSYFNPFTGSIVGTGLGEQYYFNPTLPPSKFENGEWATRFSRDFGGYNAALYFYKGFYKNPNGAVMTADGPMPVFPKLNVYGASIRGPLAGGIVWAEGGYFDSRQDRGGQDPLMPNSSTTGMVGFERQVATNLTVNAQWQFDAMASYDAYKEQQTAMHAYVRDKVSHLLTSRITKLLHSELITLSGFVFYSPSDQDVYARLSGEYKYTDQVTFAVGANLFDGKHEATNFGQFKRNDNVYLKVTYNY
ncbi:MAG TPA: DUF1302 family protein [Candidatus Acidoferrum sp.]|nr:DUF1302 family protein [Candidatus Acidoferrum sp.]